MNMDTHTVKATSIAPLRNVAAMVNLVETLRASPQTGTRFGVFSGPSGFGKTVASTFAQNSLDAIYIEVREYWSRKTFAAALVRELGQQPKGTVSDMMEQIAYVLGSDPGRAVIIDEADKLVDKGMIELARDVAEMTNAPLILVGEERLPSKLGRYERVHNRVRDFVLAQPCDLGDAQTLATLIAPTLTVADDLLEEIVRKTEGRTRRIANTLYEIAGSARRSGERAFTAETYRGRIFTGETPVRRGGVA